MNTTVWSRSAGSAPPGMSTPFGMTRILVGDPARAPTPPPSATRRSARRSGPSGTPRTSARRASSRGRRARDASRRSGTGRARASRRRSRASSARAGARRRTAPRRARRACARSVRGERTMFGSEPFAGTTTDRPTGMIPSGSGPCRPLRGWRKRVKLPGRVVAHHDRHLVPAAPQARPPGARHARPPRPSTTTRTARRSRSSCRRPRRTPRRAARAPSSSTSSVTASESRAQPAPLGPNPSPGATATRCSSSSRSAVSPRGSGSQTKNVPSHTTGDGSALGEQRRAGARTSATRSADRLLRPLERGDRGALQRLEDPDALVVVQEVDALDDLRVADDEADAPAGHPVRLRHRPHLDADVLRARRREEALRRAAVVDEVDVGRVVDDGAAGALRPARPRPRRRRRARRPRTGSTGS